MEVRAPEAPTVTVIDYEITLGCGKDLPLFTVRPDLGDTESSSPTHIRITFARTKHEVLVDLRHVAVISRREREMRLPQPKLDPNKATDGKADHARS